MPEATLLVISDTGPGVILLPEVIRRLERLRDVDTRCLLFPDVINARRLFNAANEAYWLRGLLSEFSDTSYSALEQDSVARTIEQANVFLSIEVNAVPPLLEFQFSLFGRAGDRDTLVRRYPLLPIFDVSAREISVSAIIDPNDPNYRIQLDDALARLFPRTNRPPTSAISINGGPALLYSETYVGRSDTVRIDASGSGDPDTPRARFRYAWRQIDPADPDNYNIAIEHALGLDASDTLAVQIVVPDSVGTYWIAVTVSDQVSSSAAPAIAVLTVIEKPAVAVSRLIEQQRGGRQLGLLDGPLSVFDEFAVAWPDGKDGDSLCLGFRGDPALSCRTRLDVIVDSIDPGRGARAASAPCAMGGKDGDSLCVRAGDDRSLSCHTRRDVIRHSSDTGLFSMSASSPCAREGMTFLVETATYSSQALIIEPRRFGIRGARQVLALDREWSSPFQLEFVAEWLFGRSDSTVSRSEGPVGQVQGFSSSSLNLALQLDMYIVEELALVTSVPLRLNQVVGLGRFFPDIGVTVKPLGTRLGRVQPAFFLRGLPASEFFLPAPVTQPDLLARGRTFWYALFGVGVSYKAGRILQSGFELGAGPGLRRAPEELLWDLRFTMSLDLLGLLGS